MRYKSLIFLVMLSAITGCSQNHSQGAASQEAVAQVNKYTITVDDFNHEASLLQPMLRSISSIPPIELKLSILDEMINRELLLEEAQRINIDKDPEFMRQIENFWRLSMIKQLLKYEITRIQSSTIVSDEEIQAEYALEKNQMESPKSLQAMAPQIKEILFRLKVQKALQAWEDSLKTNAVIKRHYGVLNALPIGAIQGEANGQGK